jgi:hypothetical protein
MDKLVLYCKSYKGDYDRLVNLATSIKQFNKDNIKFYISVPKEDVSLFKQIENAIVICDDDIYQFSNPGWTQQQIIKANFWKLGLTENYLCLDSDSYFIKPFELIDFMYDDQTPYTVMHEQKELFSWSVSRTNSLGFDPKDGFIIDRKKIMEEIFDRKGRIYDFGPSPIIWSSKVWSDLEKNYMEPNGLKFEHLIEYSHSEFSWYGEALLNYKSIPIYPVEPLFKVFHYPQQYIEYKQQGVTEEMIAQNYMGIILQSNWNAPLKYKN